jgi:hypothetical protein
MTEVETLERGAFVMLLRSKTALGRLNDTEVHSVLDFLENLGFARPATSMAPPVVAPIEPAPVIVAPAPAAPVVVAVPPAPIVPPVIVPEPVVVPPAPVVAPVVAPIVPPAPVVSALASLGSIIEADVEAFFSSHPAPAAK